MIVVSPSNGTKSEVVRLSIVPLTINSAESMSMSPKMVKSSGMTCDLDSDNTTSFSSEMLIPLMYPSNVMLLKAEGEIFGK